MGLETPVVQEMKTVLTAVGTTSRVFSLADIRYLVGSLSNIPELYSGRQQDGVEYLTLLLQQMGSPIRDIFSFTEKVVNKFLVDGGPSACPRCDTMPEIKSDKQLILQLHVQDTELSLKLENLIYRHFEMHINDEGKRCTRCCPHQQTRCPGTASGCVSRPFTEERFITKFPSVLLIQLKRFKHDTNFGTINKVHTYVEAQEEIIIQETQYKLIGILNHNGTYNAGHYTSLLKHDEKWFLCNDGHLPQEVKSNAVRTRDNYMYVYQKKIAESSNGSIPTFVPTYEWQEVPEGCRVPGGLEFDINLTTGVKRARLPRSSNSQRNKNVPETKENRKRSTFDGKENKFSTIYVSSHKEHTSTPLDNPVSDEPENDVYIISGTKKGRLFRPSSSKSKPGSPQIQPNEEHVMNVN